MNCSDTFEELDKTKHDRGSFDCGERELNLFIQTQAAKHMKAGISRTLILPAIKAMQNQKYPICSFFSVAPSSIHRETFPSPPAKKLPRYPIPVFLIAQLAVNKELHGKGLGKAALIKALEYLGKANLFMPANAVVVDPLTDFAGGFYSKYGFEKLDCGNGEQRMFLPMKTVDKMF